MIPTSRWTSSRQIWEGRRVRLGASASQRGYAHMGLILLVYVPCRACQCVAHVRACLSRLIDMIVTAGEAYGYHVAAILWLAAHVPQIASIWFDVNCRLKPFMLKNLEKCANAPYLQKMFGFAAPAILALRNAAFAIDEMHGSTHKGSCRDEFHGTMHETIPSYRAGALLAVRRSQNAPTYELRRRCTSGAFERTYLLRGARTGGSTWTLAHVWRKCGNFSRTSVLCCT